MDLVGRVSEDLGVTYVADIVGMFSFLVDLRLNKLSPLTRLSSQPRHSPRRFSYLYMLAITVTPRSSEESSIAKCCFHLKQNHIWGTRIQKYLDSGEGAMRIRHEVHSS